MFRFLALVLALCGVVYGDSQPEALKLDRIIGGTVADINDVPYQASLNLNGAHICGATLISANWAISAAHCIRDRPVSSFSLLAGTANRFAGGQLRAVAEVINHPNFNAVTADNDISLIRVASAFVLGTSVRPATLPAQNAGVATGAYGVVSGWGFIREGGTLTNFLLRISMPVIAPAVCTAAYPDRITSNMFCAGYMSGGRDACQGDSGGPFVIDGQLVGVISWGIRCARPNFPGVYARVSSYRDWIASNTGI